MRFKLIIAGLIGTFLEIYDMSIYAFFAPLIASNFFPSMRESSALLSTFCIFFVGFIVRPVGAMIFGHIGDTRGRKQALVATILLISCGTVGIGLLPNAQHIGILAPLLLILMRILQGLSFSAEYVGSLILMMEQAPPQRRGFMGSWAAVGANLGILSASLVCLATTALLSPQQLANWGWRLPFLLALVGGILGWYFRMHVVEDVALLKKNTQDARQSPLIQVAQSHKRDTLLIACAVGFYVVINYLFLVYIPSYFKTELHFSMNAALAINSLAIGVMIILLPVFAALSDKYGRKFLLIAAVITVILAIYPYFLLLATGKLHLIILAELLIIIPSACFISVLPIACVEQVKINVRFTGMALAYNIAAVIFGGTTPLVAVWLLQKLHSSLLLSAYVITLGFIAIAACLHFKETYQLSSLQPAANANKLLQVS